MSDSYGPSPFEKSAMLLHLGSQKKSSGGAAASSDEAKAAPSAKVESIPSSGSRGDNAGESPQIKIKVLGSGEHDKTKNSGKILEL